MTHSTTRESSSALLPVKRLRTRLDACKPTLDCAVAHKQFMQMPIHEDCNRVFSADDPAWVRNFSGPPNWIESIITKKTKPVSYSLQVNTPIACSNWWWQGDENIRHLTTTTEAYPVNDPVFHPDTAGCDSTVLVENKHASLDKPLHGCVGHRLPTSNAK